MYSEICLDESSSISYDIQDNTNLKKINFRANIDTNTTFVKTFHIAIKINDKYELLIINVKRIDNCIYVYKIFNNVTKLLKTIDLTEEYNTGNNDIDTQNNILLYKLIKVSHDWKTLTIPTGTHIMLCSTQSIFNNDINYEKIQFNIIENISRYKFFAYSDRIPLKELDSAIDAHFDSRMELKKLRKILADLAYQNPEAFKSIVKKVQSSLN